MKKQNMIIHAEYKDDSGYLANHSHLSCEMVYVKRGKALFTVCSKACTVSAGQFILITAMEEHSAEALENPYERYFFTVSSEKVMTELKSQLLTGIFLRHTKDSYFVFECSAFKGTAEAILEGLMREYEQQQNLSEEYTASLMRQLFILLYRHNRQIFEKQNNLNFDVMLKVQNYIEEHFMKDVRMEELADQAFLSVGYLSHSFKAYSGYSPKQYITQTRLMYSRELLLTTDLPVSSVAEKSGFSDANNFIRKFKDDYGITPKKFRDQNGKG